VSEEAVLVLRNRAFVGRMWSNQNQQAQQQKTLGMTSAISQAFPKAIDLQRTKELEEALKPYDVFESEAELNHRSVFFVLLEFRNSLD